MKRNAALRSTPLINLALAALLSYAAPEWGAHLLACGFTYALRTIQSAQALAGSEAPWLLMAEIEEKTIANLPGKLPEPG